MLAFTGSCYQHLISSGPHQRDFAHHFPNIPELPDTFIPDTTYRVIAHGYVRPDAGVFRWMRQVQRIRHAAAVSAQWDGSSSHADGRLLGNIATANW
jgi:hypothetical protein